MTDFFVNSIGLMSLFKAQNYWSFLSSRAALYWLKMANAWSCFVQKDQTQFQDQTLQLLELLNDFSLSKSFSFAVDFD